MGLLRITSIRSERDMWESVQSCTFRTAGSLYIILERVSQRGGPLTLITVFPKPF